MADDKKSKLQDLLKRLKKNKEKTSADELSELAKKIEPKKETAKTPLTATPVLGMKKEEKPKPKPKPLFGTKPVFEKKSEEKHSASKSEKESLESKHIIETAFPADEPPKKSHIEAEIEKAEKIKIASYGAAEIFKISGRHLLHYQVPVPRPTSAEKTIINTIKEAATRLISIAPYRIRDPVQRRNVYFNKVIEILRDSKELNIPERRYDFYANSVVRDMVGFGLIDDLIKDDKLEEIMIIGPRKPVYVFHREYEMMTTNIEFYDNDEAVDLINRIARGVGRRVDISNPLLDARLPDGSRVNATIPPASVSGATLTIRKFRSDPFTIVDLINTNTISVDVAAFLWLAVDGMGVKPANILISGGTGSGKTTMLNVLSSLIPASERVLSIEDTAELSLPLEHWVRLEARPPGLEGKGELTIDLLTKNALRMRPDRIIVGEVRHKEATTLFTAMNTGHDGSMGTMHANSPQETIVRVTSPPMSVPELMLSSLDLILIEHRLHDKRKGTIRRITEIAEVTGVLQDKVQIQTIFERNAAEDQLVRTTAPSSYIRKIETLTGLKKRDIEEEINERKKVLQSIVDKGLREMSEVSKITQDYMDKKRELNVK